MQVSIAANRITLIAISDFAVSTIGFIAGIFKACVFITVVLSCFCFVSFDDAKMVQPASAGKFPALLNDSFETA